MKRLSNKFKDKNMKITFLLDSLLIEREERKTMHDYETLFNIKVYI